MTVTPPAPAVVVVVLADLVLARRPVVAGGGGGGGIALDAAAACSAVVDAWQVGGCGMGETGVLPVLISGPRLGGAVYVLAQVAVAVQVGTAGVAVVCAEGPSGVAVASVAPAKEESWSTIS